MHTDQTALNSMQYSVILTLVCVRQTKEFDIEITFSVHLILIMIVKTKKMLLCQAVPNYVTMYVNN